MPQQSRSGAERTNTMESTPNEKRKFSDYVRGQMDGTGPAPSGPTRPDQKLTDSIKAKLSGSDTPTPGDTQDVPQGIDADVWAKANASAHDPNSPDHDLADALLTLARQLSDLQGQNGAQQP
jgi:hypothetical protein